MRIGRDQQESCKIHSFFANNRSLLARSRQNATLRVDCSQQRGPLVSMRRSVAEHIATFHARCTGRDLASVLHHLTLAIPQGCERIPRCLLPTSAPVVHSGGFPITAKIADGPRPRRRGRLIMTGICLVNSSAASRAEALFAAIVINDVPCVVGRDPDCDRRVDNDTVSRRHCTFTFREGRAWVEDLGSLNGTFINGIRLRGARPLCAEDQLDIGSLHLRVYLPGRHDRGGAGGRS
jgi:FHA domain